MPGTSLRQSSPDRGPVLLRPEEVPNDIICAICLTIPLQPIAISTCEHIFCNDCLLQTIDFESDSCACCPVDRSEFIPEEHCYPLVRKKGSFMHRIWSSAMVKCEMHDEGCAWTGSIADYLAHARSCIRIDNNHNNALMEELEALEECQSELAEVKAELADVKAKLATARGQRDAYKALCQDQERQLASRPNLPILFDGNYNFYRTDVVQLSQLISRYLYNKPGHIDRNRIYNCVRTCYLDLVRYRDNPPNYYSDVRMLLATCVSSNWFSDKQWDNISTWMQEQEWL